MVNGGLSAILGHLHRAVRVGDNLSRSDADLLSRFVDAHDELAGEALVRRHAFLVWNVCRRILHEDSNAEDAFQAVFLTLVRKAHTIGQRASVASWLHKVAYRIALEARRQAVRRSAREVPVMEHHLSRPGDDAALRELRPVIDEEVCRLPEKYRAPVVLCYLQGKSNAQAARELGCPSGTVVTRLAWARRRLRKRLVQRGLSATTGILGAALFRRAEAAAPSRLLDATVCASLQLARGVMPTAGTETAFHLSRAATRTLSSAHLKFAAVVTSLILVGSAATMREQNTVGEPPIHATTPATTERMAARSDSNEPAANGSEPVSIEEHPAQAENHSKNRLLGFFERTDVAENTVTFTENKGVPGRSRTLPLAVNATITRRNRPVRLADLKPGCKLKLFLSADGSKVTEIRVKDENAGNLTGKNTR